VHSFLGAFGKIENGEQTVFGAFRHVLGDSGTLIAPTYNYDFCRGAPYDHLQTKSQVGQFTEFLRLHSGVKRSFHPVYSHAVLGGKQEFFLENPSKSAFGKGSFFNRLHDQNALLVFLGASVNSATFIHYVEQALGVAYRFSKIFSGKVTYEGKTYDDSFEIFSRYLELDTELDLRPLLKRMESRGLAKKTSLGRGMVIGVRTADLFNEAAGFYKENPFCLLARPIPLDKLAALKTGDQRA
jgi:aminoglycoside N3'-acetyltransferase